jgi:hypothetical protein
MKGLRMSDVRTSPPQGSTEQRSCQATITKGFKGYTVAVSLKEDGRTRVLTQKTVDSYGAAETVARVFAS